MTVFGQVSLGLAVVKKLVLQLGALVSKVVEAVAKRALKSYIGTKSDMYSGKNFSVAMLFLKYLCILNGRGINGSPTTSWVRNQFKGVAGKNICPFPLTFECLHHP